MQRRPRGRAGRVALAAQAIEARPVWKPMHLQPVYAGCEVVGGAVASGGCDTVYGVIDDAAYDATTGIVGGCVTGEHDCREASAALDHIRRNRRSQSPEDLAKAASVLGYWIDKRRGKGSHWYARGGPGPHFPIPTSRDPVSVGVTTRVLRILEEVDEDVCGG